MKNTIHSIDDILIISDANAASWQDRAARELMKAYDLRWAYDGDGEPVDDLEAVAREQETERQLQTRRIADMSRDLVAKRAADANPFAFPYTFAWKPEP